MGRRFAGKHLPARRACLAAAATLTAAAALAAFATPSDAAPRAVNAADTGRHLGGEATARQLAALMQQDVDAGAPGVVVRVDRGRGKTISLMLLNHTSGLFDYVNDPGVLARETGADPSSVTPAELLAVSAQYPPLFKPGTEYAYSNTDYVALGLVLEKATGRTVATLLHQRIIQPLGLRAGRRAARRTDGRGRFPGGGHAAAEHDVVGRRRCLSRSVCSSSTTSGSSATAWPRSWTARTTSPWPVRPGTARRPSRCAAGCAPTC